MSVDLSVYQLQCRIAKRLPYGLFQFSRMPFGLQGAPTTFQHMIDKILDQMGGFISAYIDNVIVCTMTWQEHLDRLKAVLSKIQQSRLMLKKRSVSSQCPSVFTYAIRSGVAESVVKM